MGGQPERQRREGRSLAADNAACERLAEVTPRDNQMRAR